tara:strand:+ start:1420 stop:1746 length:327 start_codon:yes stop_codon:yes gene_type:complete
MINKKQETITSKDFKRVFWFNENQDFVCNSINSFNENKKKGLEFEVYQYVEEWLAFHRAFNDSDIEPINPIRDIEKVFEIFRQLVIVSMGGFSTDLDSYRNKKKLNQV